MTNTQAERFLGTLHNCYFTTDPRVNRDLALKLTGKNVLIAGAGRGKITFDMTSIHSTTVLANLRARVTSSICERRSKQLQHTHLLGD